MLVLGRDVKGFQVSEKDVEICGRTLKMLTRTERSDGAKPKEAVLCARFRTNPPGEVRRPAPSATPTAPLRSHSLLPNT